MPSTCLLITTCNRGHLLERSLAHLRGFTQPDEVLIVDDGGCDATSNVAAAYGCRYIYTHHPGPTLCAHARNVGLTHTDADLLITSEPEVYFLTDVVAQFLELRDGNTTLNAGAVDHEQGEGGGWTTLYDWTATFCAMYERQHLLDIGGWDESFPEPWGWDDTDLLTRLNRAGHEYRIIRDIHVRHQWHPQTANNQFLNEKHFLAKRFAEEPHDNPHVIIPREAGWGTPLTRS